MKTTTILTEQQIRAIDTLWNQEYPVGLTNRFGIMVKETTNLKHYLLEDENEILLAWAATFDREGENWFSIVVDNAVQGKGIGKRMIEELKAHHNELNGWVIDHSEDKRNDGKPYVSPLAFYLKYEFVVIPEIRIDSEMIKAVKIRWNKNEHTI